MPKRPCKKCGASTHGTLCEKCSPVDIAALYASNEWKQLSRAKRIANPLCEECGRLAEQVHHKRSANEYPMLFFDWDNLQSVCKECHGKKRKSSNS
jgi:5-methylcytosine-specific restriction endonuclease McrA